MIVPLDKAFAPPPLSKAFLKPDFHIHGSEADLTRLDFDPRLRNSINFSIRTVPTSIQNRSQKS